MDVMERVAEYYRMCPSGNEDDMLKHIEECGRICYKSEHKINHEERSFEKFYNLLLKKRHMSAIEHSNVVVELEFETLDDFELMYSHFVQSALYQMAYFRVMPIYDTLTLTIAGNIRVWDEFISKKWWFVAYKELSNFLYSNYPIIFSNFPSYLETNLPNRENIPELKTESEMFGKYSMRIVSDAEMMLNFSTYDAFDIPVYTFFIVTDRGISHEIVRHRVLSFSQESTRYINYKSNGIKFMPLMVDMSDDLIDKYIDTMDKIDELYKDLISDGVTPQYARAVLPNITKTEMFVSGRMTGWKNFVDLRKTPNAHPDIKFIANYVEDILGLGDQSSNVFC